MSLHSRVPSSAGKLASNVDGFYSLYRQGAESTQDEVAASAFLAVEVDDELEGSAVQVNQLGTLSPVC